MLKQQSVETQPVTHTSLPLPVQTSHAATINTSSSVRDSAVTRRLLPPLHLSLGQIAMALLLPLVYGGLLVAIPLLPKDFLASDSGVMLQVALLLVVPFALCVAVSSYLRNRRIAALHGALLGLIFSLTGPLMLWLHQQYRDLYGLPLHQLSVSVDSVLWIMFAGVVVALVAASFSQSNRGRRVMPDRNRNR